MKLLILTQYYPPEVGAPQNRLSDLAVRFLEKGVEISVLTGMPNYPQMEIHPAYKGKWRVREIMEGVTVHRSWIYVSRKRSVFHRLMNYFSFVFSSLWVGLFYTGSQDYILVESPPLFLGISGYILKVFKRSRMIFNVSDLWPESAEKLGIVRSRLFLKMAYRLETFLYRHSFLISGQTKGICENITKRFPGVVTYWLPNGVDPGAFDPSQSGKGFRTAQGLSKEEFVVLYAGIIGYAQGLSTLLKTAEILREEGDIRFFILGSGPEKEMLVSVARDQRLDNVTFPPPVGKSGIPEILAGADAIYVPLKKLEIFLGAIPSKIFEALAMSKPVLLAVEGEARHLFIEEGRCGLFVEPENPGALAEAILRMKSDRKSGRQMGENGREFVIRYFNRRNIAYGFHDFILEMERQSS